MKIKKNNLRVWRSKVDLQKHHWKNVQKASMINFPDFSGDCLQKGAVDSFEKTFNCTSSGSISLPSPGSGSPVTPNCPIIPALVSSSLVSVLPPTRGDRWSERHSSSPGWRKRCRCPHTERSTCCRSSNCWSLT